MINNFEQIKQFINAKSEDDFWHCQICKRKKEHPELGSKSYIVKTYYIRSIEHLEKCMPEIIALCTFHNARGYINLNRRSFEKCAYQMLKKVTDQILNKDFKSVKSAYDSVAGQFSNEPDTKWIIDIDIKDDLFVNRVCNDINNCEPNRRQNKIYTILPTKNGVHIISKPFNMQEFSEINHTIDIHKNNPTILFIP